MCFLFLLTDYSFDFGWVFFGPADSVCVLCCGGAERAVLVLLLLGFCSCWFWVLMAVMLR